MIFMATTAIRQAASELVSIDGGPPSARGSHVAARSKHPGGVNSGMADGSTHFVSNDIDVVVWQSMGTRAGGEIASLD